ncbi:hypothetical protein ABVT39_024270 [Epinephelus coioides]
MDLYRRTVQDLHLNPKSTLDWVAGYLRHLNAPEAKTVTFRATLLRLTRHRTLSLASCKRAWDRSLLLACIGVAVDTQCKDVYNGKRLLQDVGSVARLILTQLQALHLTPVCGGLKVAGIPTPNMSSTPGRYTYHNGCTRGCSSIRATWGFYTEVDLVAHDTVTDTIALLELKTRNNDILDRATLWRYNAQLWLTWIMFSLTYPSMAERSAAYLVMIRPGTNQVTIRRCLRPTISKAIRNKFPWLNCFCPQVLKCLAPMCVNMTSETRSSIATKATTPWLDRKELCYRNICFNQEKMKMKIRTAKASVPYN